jgi:flagellar basal-body rod protein FlgG
MMQSLNTAATGMVAQQYNLDVIANNLANVNTNAFKQQRAEFQDLMYRSVRASGVESGDASTQPVSVQVGLGSRFVSSSSIFTEGPPQATGNPLDFAVAGNGFFKIQGPGGETAYTRDGAFKLNADGQLVTSDGYRLEPEITIPTGSTAVTVSPNGVVSARPPGAEEPQEIGRLQLTVFPNPAGLTRIGQNLYRGGGATGDPIDVTPGEQGSGSILSGFVEGSNVQVVEEMVRMILAQRAYEINSKAIQTADDMLGVMNNLKR